MCKKRQGLYPCPKAICWHVGEPEYRIWNFFCVQSHNSIVCTGRHSEKWVSWDLEFSGLQKFKCENEEHIGQINGIGASTVVERGTRQHFAGPNKIVEGTDTNSKPTLSIGRLCWWLLLGCANLQGTPLIPYQMVDIHKLILLAALVSVMHFSLAPSPQ